MPEVRPGKHDGQSNRHLLAVPPLFFRIRTTTKDNHEMNRDYFDQLEHEADQHELAEKIERDERMAVAPDRDERILKGCVALETLVETTEIVMRTIKDHDLRRDYLRKAFRLANEMNLSD